MRGDHVYMMSNKPHGVLYGGLTADLAARAWQHKNGTGQSSAESTIATSAFLQSLTQQSTKLLHAKRQSQAWPRLWKLELIHALNPSWDDLSTASIGDRHASASWDLGASGSNRISAFSA